MNGIYQNLLTDIKNAIEFALLNFQLKRQHVYADIQVTDLTQCLRKSYFTKKENAICDNPNVQLIIGILLHDIVLKELEEVLDGKSEVLTVHVIPYNGEFIKLYGMCDFLADNYILELKTCFKTPEKPFDNHIEQVNAYLHMFDRENGYIVYLSRNSLDIRIFEVEKDEVLWNNTINRAVLLHEALKRDEPPEPEPSHLCEYCPYKHKCNI